MTNRTRFAALLSLAIATVVVVPAKTVSATSVTDAQTTAMADRYGLTIEEADRRLAIQDLAGELEETLLKVAPNEFAGLWIDHEPEFSVTVAATGAGLHVVETTLQASKVAGVVRLVEVQHSLSDLTKAAEDILAADGKVPFDLMIDVRANGITVHVIDEHLAFADQLGAEIAPSVVVVDELARPAANIYGGLSLSCGTSGFSVKSTISGERGITAAGHCPNSVSYQGVPLAYRDRRFFGSHDEQWHSAPGLFNVVSGWIHTGSGGGRNITAVRHRENQPIGAFVCKYGKMTFFDCGTIVNKTIAPGYVPNPSPTFIGLDGGTTDICTPGDSGGPIFSGNTAFGMTSGCVGSNGIDDVMYVAINYVESGLSVKVTFPGQ